jgi:transcriptional regulator with PAS, ATPase and Fis domain
MGGERGTDRRDALVDRIIGSSATMRQIKGLIRRIAGNHSTILITGASGSGKELVARTIHDMSDRADGPFMAVNCGAMPESLLESQLFGHEKGSFTGATERVPGIFRAAEGGTVFLDEITEMHPALQVRLLRVLQEREVTPVGGTEAIPVDVRIIAATNQPLNPDQNMALRNDLFYRLSVVQMHLPSVCERRQDVPELIDYFNRLHAFAYRQSVNPITPERMRALAGYAWPGNVRELSNVIENWYATGVWPAKFEDPGTMAETVEADLESIPTLDQAEKALVIRALAAAKGNKGVAARALKIERHRLYRKIEKYDIAAG